MYSSQVIVGDTSITPPRGLLERMRWTERLPMAFVFGCLLGLSSPGFDQWWIAWVGVAPLLVLVRASGSKMEGTLIGTSFGLGYYLVALSWYLGIFPLRWLGIADWLAVWVAGSIWLLESVHQSLLFAGFAFIVFCLPARAGYLPHWRRPYFPFLLTAPLLYIFFHWVISPSEIFVGLPVNQLAYSQSRLTDLIQIARLGGGGLVDFLIVLCNATIAALILECTGIATRFKDRVDRFSLRFGAILDVAVVALLVVLSLWWGGNQVKATAVAASPEYALTNTPMTPAVPVAVVQGNVTVEEDLLKTSSPTEIAERYASLGRGLGVAILFFPEGLVNAVQMQPGYLLARLKDISYREKKEVVVGAIEQLKGGFVNAARLISILRPSESFYVKQRQVPMAEFASLRSMDQIPESIRKRLPSSNEVFPASQSTNLLRSIWGRIGVSIYIEVIYPRLVAEEVRSGAHLLVNLSNLGWFHGSALNRQVMAASIFRAVENGRFMVVATNTGISAIIDPAGVVTSASYPGKRGTLIDTVQFLYNKTPFTQMWWL